ncbi:NHL domain-containing protein [Mucilaginibacter ginkgonis]|uniref:Uncharacterized protein n=1 Tax=Mucilaginibacter ginkgonis TaxID=2682091 RepID=A0A6I4INB7_9SPHI|nr:hypothetical protein [Mucilaginibacter ginkgonis]QQL49613.1 hypothetical protein GO620_015790 [Mucilaginibacter ginkgonis]
MRQFLPLPIKLATLVAFFALTITACKKDSTTTTAPTISTGTLLTDVTTTSFTSAGVVTDLGTSAITEVGLVYSSANQSPTTSDTKVANAALVANYAITISNLTPGTTYYVRAYATSAAGTSYGSTVKVTTQTAATATVATVSTFAGSGTAGYVDGGALAAQFNNPQGMVADAQGNIYVCDQFNHLVRKITPAGVVSTFCGSGALGHTDGPAATAAFYSPYALAVDKQNNLYMTDQGNNLVIKITPAGVATTLAGSGIAGYVNSNTALTAQFNAPRGIAVDASGNIYVADSNNSRIRMISTAGVVTTFAGGGIGFTDDTGALALFRTPTGLAFDTNGNLFVADYGNYAIRKITSAGVVTTVAGNRSITTLIGNPNAIAIDAANNLYIADGTGRVLRLQNSSGILNSIAGSASVYGFADGTNTAAKFNVPTGIVTVGGALYVADYNNNLIRKITITN